MKLTFSCHNVRYMQLVTSIIATLLIANSGMFITWSSPSLPKLQSEDSPIGETISKAEASWVASSFMFGIMLGGFITGITMEKLGRKWSLMVCAVPLFAAWIVVAFAQKAIIVIVARSLAGFSAAIALAAVPVYCGEIAENDIRGKLGTAFNVLKLLGSLYVLSVGPYLSYRVLTLSCSALPVIFVVLFYFMPESPMYLVKIGKKDLARKNVIRLSSNDADDKGIQSRMEEIQTTVDYDMRNQSSMKEFLTNPEYRMSLIVMTGVKSLQQLSGMNAIDPYLQTIIRASNSGISEDISSIICGVVQIIGAICSSILVDKMGRKPLLIISALGCGTALVTLGTYFYFDQVIKADVSAISWLPTTALALYLFMNPLGVFTLSYVLLGELFATNIKSSAITVMTVYGAFLGFMVAKFFEPISTAWGMYTMFWIFAGFCIAGTIFVFFFLPETKVIGRPRGIGSTVAIATIRDLGVGFPKATVSRSTQSCNEYHKIAPGRMGNNGR